MPFAVEISRFIGVLSLLLGLWGVLAPSRVADLAQRFGSAGGLWIAAAIRLVFGLALWFAAPASHAPMLFQIFGVVALLAALLIPLMGLRRFKALIDWWTTLSPAAMRLNCLVAAAFGGVVLWALLPVAS